MRHAGLLVWASVLLMLLTCTKSFADNSTDTTHAAELFRQGYVFMHANSYTKAIKCFTEGLALAPDSPRVYADRGNCYYLSHQDDRAIEDLTKAMFLGFDTTGVYLLRAQCSLRKHRLKAAISDLDIALENDPTNPELNFLRGQAYAGLSEDPNHAAVAMQAYRKALDAYNIAIDKDKSNAQMIANRAFCCYLLARYDDCLRDVKMAKSKGMKTSGLYFLEAQSLLRKQDYLDASKVLKEAIVLYPEDAELRKLEAQALQGQKEARRRYHGPLNSASKAKSK